MSATDAALPSAAVMSAANRSRSLSAMISAACNAGSTCPAYNSSRASPLPPCAATLDPAEVPTSTSAPVKSCPRSASPASTPVIQAIPPTPPPPSTNASVMPHPHGRRRAHAQYAWGPPAVAAGARADRSPGDDVGGSGRWRVVPVLLAAQLVLQPLLGRVDLRGVLALGPVVDVVAAFVDALACLVLVTLQHALDLVHHGHGVSLLGSTGPVTRVVTGPVIRQSTASERTARWSGSGWTIRSSRAGGPVDGHHGGRTPGRRVRPPGRALLPTVVYVTVDDRSFRPC